MTAPLLNRREEFLVMVTEKPMGRGEGRPFPGSGCGTQSPTCVPAALSLTAVGFWEGAARQRGTLTSCSVPGRAWAVCDQGRGGARPVRAGSSLSPLPAPLCGPGGCHLPDPVAAAPRGGPERPTPRRRPVNKRRARPGFSPRRHLVTARAEASGSPAP